MPDKPTTASYLVPFLFVFAVFLCLAVAHGDILPYFDANGRVVWPAGSAR